ncbi:hypothetical protein TrispH2_008046 [Trichoplax sp. H2]|nr:hypothetical protein TrispH2_008046 [Trichoplax sp. H2]|eukprot:RDD40791.1 hypothetical protein TrispH2_008046 [Trichoplax sp. H2]
MATNHANQEYISISGETNKLFDRTDIHSKTLVISIITDFILGITSIIFGAIGFSIYYGASDIAIQIGTNLWIGALYLIHAIIFVLLYVYLKPALEIIYIMSMIITISATVIQAIINLVSESIIQRFYRNTILWYGKFVTVLAVFYLLVTLIQLVSILRVLYRKMAQPVIGYNIDILNFLFIVLTIYHTFKKDEAIPNHQLQRQPINTDYRLSPPKRLHYISIAIGVTILSIGIALIVIQSYIEKSPQFRPIGIVKVKANSWLGCIFAISAISLLASLRRGSHNLLTVLSFGFLNIISALSIVLFSAILASTKLDPALRSLDQSWYVYTTYILSGSCFVLSIAMVLIYVHKFKNLTLVVSIEECNIRYEFVIL